MLLILRKIRRKLMENLPAGKAGNRITTYLLYAIGEIVLVVIGILIAVSLNNWNQNRKDRIQERNFIQLLIKDLLADSVSLSGKIESSNQVVLSKSIWLQYKKGSAASDSTYQHIQNAIFTGLNQFVPNEGAMEEIKNAGGISLIKDDSLQSQILALYNAYEIFEKNVGQYHLDNTLRIRELVFEKANGEPFGEAGRIGAETLERLALDNDIRNRVINNWAITYNQNLKMLGKLNGLLIQNCRSYIGSDQ